MTKTHVFSLTTLVALLSAFILMTAPVSADAATYAYVDAEGAVKTVEATDWMSAIASAVNIHVNSGVALLDTTKDFLITAAKVNWI